MGKNIRSLQLLRNTTLFTSKEAAIEGIQSGATNDGTVKLARYEVDGKVKTIFGICHNPSEDTTSGATGFSYTIYDSPQEVIEALKVDIKANKDAIAANKTDIATNKAAIATLNGADTVDGSVSKKIKDAIEGLDVTEVGGTGKVITAISETNGKISATASDLTAGIVAATAITSGDTTIAVEGTTVAAQIASLAQHIGGLDVADTAVTGEYVSAVSETDGKIAVTRVALPTVAEITSAGQAIVAVKEDKGVISATAGDIAAAHVTIADSGSHFTVTTVEAALEELYSQAGDGSKVELKEAAGTEGILKVYTIKQGGDVVGTINIPKDLVVTSGSVVKGNWVNGVFTESASGTGTALKLVIANQDDPVYINTLDLVKDHTAGNGIAISDTNVVSVKRDADSEGFLTVSADGVKVSGVQNAIDTAAKKAATEVVEDAAGHVTVTKATGANGQAVYTIGENDIASANLLGTATDNKDANTAFGKIAKEVADREAAIQTQKNALDAEIAARKAVDGQSGATYSANTTATYISGANSLNDADVKLDAAIKASVTATTAAIDAEKSARETEDAKIVAGVGFSTGDTYLIAAHSGTGVSVTAASTVKDAIYTLDNAIAAAKLTKADDTVVVTSGATGTTVKVNIESVKNDGNKIVTFDGTKFIYSEAILDAGTY